jgi:hypothetical protein
MADTEYNAEEAAELKRKRAFKSTEKNNPLIFTMQPLTNDEKSFPTVALILTSY